MTTEELLNKLDCDQYFKLEIVGGVDTVPTQVNNNYVYAYFLDCKVESIRIELMWGRFKTKLEKQPVIIICIKGEY